MRHCALLLLVLFLGACQPSPEGRLKLVTIESAEAGLSLRELPRETLKSIGLPFGLAVVKAGGLAERSGLRIGDVVYGVNQNRVKSLEEFNKALAQRNGSRLGLLVRRGRTDLYVAVDFAGDSAPKGPAPRDTLLRT